MLLLCCIFSYCPYSLFLLLEPIRKSFSKNFFSSRSGMMSFSLAILIISFWSWTILSRSWRLFSCCDKVRKRAWVLLTSSSFWLFRIVNKIFISDALYSWAASNPEKNFSQSSNHCVYAESCADVLMICFAGFSSINYLYSIN